MLATRQICNAIVLAAIVVSGLRGQASNGVRFVLATKDGKTSFRLGEAVEVEFRFESSAPGDYAAWTLRPVRQVRQPEYDRFIVEPSESVADPLADIFAQMSGGMIIGQLPRPTPLKAAPVTVGLQMNEWLSIRKPGHYRITAETTRVVTTAEPSTPVPLRSNSIEIDVIPPEQGWAAVQLQQASAMLQIADPPAPRVGQSEVIGVREAHEADAARAARTLRFLETPEAAQALSRFFEHGPQAAQSELHAGLFASPYRKEVIAAMEAAVEAPDIPVTYYYLGTLMELAEVTRFGPMPLYTPKSNEDIGRWIDDVEGPYRARAKPVETEYFAKLANAVGRKQGEALAVSLETLVSRGPQPTPPATAKALVANFRMLPESSQETLLAPEWYRIASPELAPMLQSIAEGNGPLRDSALRRLQELAPEAARKITLARIQKADVMREAYRSYRVLLTLPDKTLPTADEALVTALEQNKPEVEVLIARYASDAVLPRLKAWVEQRPQRMCAPVLPTYFFRVDAEWAASALARARQAGHGACAINVSPNEDLLMSPGLEKQAIEDLSNPDLMIRRSAMTLLQHGGSAGAEKPLLDAFAHLRDTPAKTGDMMSAGMEQAFVTALLSASGWLPNTETFNQVTAYCGTDECRRQVASTQKLLRPPISIDVSPTPVEFNSFFMGLLDLHSLKQAQDKISQFPKGTPFFVTGNGPGSWYFEQREAQTRTILADEGMKIVDRPAPAPR
jgi:hypothetical protein